MLSIVYQCTVHMYHPMNSFKYSSYILLYSSIGIDTYTPLERWHHLTPFIHFEAILSSEC